MHELEVDSGSCVIFCYHNIILLPRLNLSMSNKKISNEVITGLFVLAAALITGLFTLIAPLITNPPKSQEPNPQNPIPEQLAEGQWEIVEKLTIKDKSLNIVWRYIPSIEGNALILKGRKVKVDYKNPTSGEKKAVSICTLKLKEKKAEGGCKEFNDQGDLLETSVKLEFSDDFRSVTGYFEKDGRRGPRLTGTKSSI